VVELEKKKKSILGIIGIIVIAVGLGSFFFFEVGGETIKIDVRLEDLAGNNIQGKFDRDAQSDDLLYLDQKEIVLEFTI